MTRVVLSLWLALILVLPALAEGPPRETGDFRKPDLVELVRLDPSMRLDIRYATPQNFMGRALYPQARAFLQRPAALALVEVDRSLRAQGYGLSVLDAYRPWSITRKMWEQASQAWRDGGYVADPARGSRHNRGAAVDVSLYDRATGRYLPMPSAYDEFTGRARADYAGGTREQRQNRDLLIAAMQHQGFQVLGEEWWHFDFRAWKEYPILDLQFSEIPLR